MALLSPLRGHRPHKQAVVCAAGVGTWGQPAGAIRPRSRHTCSASSAADGASKLPVVDDAISLPPPATGSQYAWRRSWGGSSSSSSAGSGGGGGSGRSWQARTRDWGRGPNSSMLFVILYRMRLLLLYGVWVTVLYGAFRAVVDLTTAAGKAGYHFINAAADMLYGPSGGAQGSDGGLTAGAPAAAAAVEGAAEAQEQEAAAGDAAGLAQDITPAAGGASGSSSSSSGSSSFPANQLSNRPTAGVFENMMSAVIPVYLMLLGSVVFFASV